MRRNPFDGPIDRTESNQIIQAMWDSYNDDIADPWWIAVCEEYEQVPGKEFRE